MAFVVAAPGAARAFSGGLAGRSGKPPASGCGGACHAADNTARPTLQLSGPLALSAGQTGRFKLAISGLAAGAGFDIAVDGGTLAPVDAAKARLQSGEIVHGDAWPRGTRVDIDFDLVAPAEAAKVTLFFTVLSADGDGGTAGDAEASGTFQVEVGPPPDMAGVDLAGVDLAIVDFAVVDFAGVDLAKRFPGDEPRWGLACSMGRGRRAGSARGGAPDGDWLVVVVAGVVVALRRR